ncbi:MAG: FHA domain-containing protein [Planctomycetota bacterium]|nr:FHA domain-containing protein [Planctomycetota bacterium]
MLGELVPVGGGDPIPLLRSQLMVGRREGCDISLQFSNISSRHCELSLINGYWLVKDLNSSNGTKVNGVRVKTTWILPGDEIMFAKHRFKIDYDVAPGTAPPPLLDNAEDMQMSLLEKAGLARPERRPRPPAARPPAPPAGGAGKPPRNEEERAFEWLQNDDE